MSAFNLIPLWLSALVVFLTGAVLTKVMGVNSPLGWIIALIFGFATWLLYGLGLKAFASALRKKNIETEKSLEKSRVYQNFDSKNFPVGNNIYYECGICGNNVLSIAKKITRCKCQNITVNHAAGQPIVANPEKIKIFSLAR